MVWMSGVSSMALLFWCYSIIRKHDLVVTAGLLMKIAAGIALGLLYKYYLGGGDTFQYFNEGKTIALYTFRHPDELFPIYFKTLNVSALADQIVYYDQPRALLFAKFISVCYIFSGGNYWIISAFLSIVNFVCVSALVRELQKSFPGRNRVFEIAFYFLPTFVFWTSGLLKESLAVAALAIMTAVILQVIRTRQTKDWPRWILAIFASWVLWQLKYYYAAVALPVLFSLLVFNLLNKKKKYQLVLFPLLICGSLLLISFLHYNLSFSRVLQVIYENYQTAVSESSGPVIRFYNFDGSLFSFLINTPVALFGGLFRPFLFDVSNVLQGIVTAENLAVLALLVFGLWKSKFKFYLKNPYVVATLLYVFSLAILLAFASPNLGTLSRYKVAYWPFFVSLVLILALNKKGRIDSTPRP